MDLEAKALPIVMVVILICSMTTLGFVEQLALKQKQFLSQTTALNAAGALRSALEYAKGQGAEENLYGSTIQLPEPLNYFETRIWSIPWGSYRIVGVLVIDATNTDTLKRSFILGEVPNQSNMALTVSANQDLLRAGPGVHIDGDISIPSGTFRRFNPGGYHGNPSPQINGTIESATSSFSAVPNWNTPEIAAIQEAVQLQVFPRIKLISGTDITTTPQDGQAGELLLYTATNSITVSPSPLNENALFIAPKITYASGVHTGSQAFAQQKLLVEERTQLHYPTNLYQNSPPNNQDSIQIIDIGSFSTIQGAIFSWGSQNTLVRINQNCTIEGTVNAEGKLHLEGKVLGRVHANTLQRHEPSGEILRNFIAEAEIDNSTLTAGFLHGISQGTTSPLDYLDEL